MEITPERLMQLEQMERNFLHLLTLANDPKQVALRSAMDSMPAIGHPGHGPYEEQPTEEEAAAAVKKVMALDPSIGQWEPQVVEPIEPPAERKMVIPDQYPLPSDDLMTCQQQYAHAVAENDMLTRMLSKYIEDMDKIAIKPSHAVRLAMGLMPIVQSVAMYLRQQGPLLNSDDYHVPKGMAQVIIKLANRTSAEAVAVSEFIEWSMAYLGSLSPTDDPSALKIAMNLQTTGMAYWTDGRVR